MQRNCPHIVSRASPWRVRIEPSFATCVLPRMLIGTPGGRTYGHSIIWWATSATRASTWTARSRRTCTAKQKTCGTPLRHLLLRKLNHGLTLLRTSNQLDILITRLMVWSGEGLTGAVSLSAYYYHLLSPCLRVLSKRPRGGIQVRGAGPQRDGHPAAAGRAV